MRAVLASWLLMTIPALAAEDLPKGTPVKNRIVAVTVYQGNALVAREVSVPEGTGTQELLVSPLPPRTLAGSPYAEGTDGIRILNTRFRSIAIKEDTREEVRKLESQIRQLNLDSQRVQADIKVAGEQTQFLTKLEGFSASSLQHLTDKGQLNSDSVIALSKFLLQTRAERAKEAVALLQKAQELTEQTEFLKRQLAEKTAGISRTERVAVITIDKANAAAGTIKLFYLVDAVAWRPQYRLRAGKPQEPVNVEYLAAVQQQTGEDWTNVAIALSTAQPLLNAAPPDLKMLEVSAAPLNAPRQAAALPPGANPYNELKKRADAGRAQGQSLQNSVRFVDAEKAINDAAACEQFGELLASRDDILAVNREYTSTPSEGPAVTYRLRGSLSMPSRNDEQILEVTRLQLTPEYYFKAVPVLTPHVYRMADLVNKSEFVLFPGEATMYQGQDFVGRMSLPLVAVGKPFSVSFGADPQISVQRTLSNKNRITSGGNQVHTFDYRLLVNSYKAEPVKVQVWDRLPKGDAQAIAVSLVSQKPDLSGDALYLREERPKNLLRWDVTVLPTQNGEKALAIDYTYKLELDKQMGIGTVIAK
ncbi:MAG: mucoidy inhibitor MuiA family protein [Gemmataceae bacterium]|nr:mucoidy inhibitor MuiA family protein [Gemmataceae bacterium]